MVYELPSSFSGGMQGAVESLKKGILPQATKPVVVPPAPMITQEQKTFLPQKPKPVDPNKTPDVFKAKFVAKYPEGVAQDGRKYKDMPAVEIVAKIVRKYPNGVTSDGIPYTDFLPRPASSSDSLEYRLSQIESLYGGPKSQFFTDGIMRGQTEKEQQFTTNVTKREKEGELVKTLKAPYRAVYSAMETPSQGLQMAVSDVLDLVGADETSKNLTKQLVKDKFEQDMLNQDNKGLIGGIQAGSPSSIIGSLVTAIPNLLLYANPVGATAGIVSTGGGLSLEGEMQGQTGFGDKVIAYSAGTISGLIDKISGQKFIDGLLSKGIEKNVAKSFVDKTINFLKTLKPSDFEAGTEVIQQKIENWGRQLMGTEYDKGWKQYAEAGIMGKLMGKVSDVGQSQAPITTLPPKQPKAVSKNLDVIQSIKTGIIGNKIIKQAKNRGFDPELDIATYEDLKPTITNDGRVNTDVAQENLQNFIEPYQEKLDQAIAEEGAFVPSETFRQNVLKEMESEKTNIVDYDKWVKMANNAIDSAVQSFGDEKGNIPLEVVNNIKKKLQSVSNYQNPDDSAYKAIARGAKQIVEDFTSSADVRALNKDLARWYTTKEYLQILGSGTKTVKGGRLGKGFARLAGVIIGSKLGPVAGMIGGEIGARLQGKMMQGALKSTKKGIPDILSFGKIKKKQQLLLPPPSGKPTSAKVVDVKPITGFLPGLLQKSESALSRQISSNNMEDKTTQSQLVQVLGGKRKKEVVSPKKESAGKKVNNPIIQKLAKKQETPKTSKSDYLSTTEAKMTDTELKSLAKKYLESSKLPVGKGRVSSDNMADYKGYARIRDYFKAQGDDSLLETKLTPKTPEDWTKKDFTKATETKSVDKFGNTVMQDSKANRSIQVNGKNYKELDLPESTRMLYTSDGKFYEYKNGKMIPEGAKTPQVEGKTVPKEILDEMNNYDNAHDFAMNAMIGPGGKVYKIGDNVKVETMAGTVDGKITKNIGKTNIVDEGKPKSSGYIQDSPNGHPVQVTLKDGTKIDTNLGLIDQDSTGDYIFGKKQSDKLRELFESKAKPKPSLTLSQKSEGKTLKDNLEWTPSSKLDQDIFYVDRNGIRQTEFESAGKNIKGQRAGYTMEEYLNKNGLSKDDFTLSKGTDGADGLYVLNEKGLSKLEKLRAGNKPKPSLPLSQKSEVKYSTDLASEAKKYKSADDFMKAQEGSMYFHGTNVDFKKPDVSKVGTGEGSIMAGKGFNLTSMSDDAKNYAYQVSQKKGGEEVILGTKIDKNKMNLFDADKMDKDVKMQSEIIDYILRKQNEFKGLTKDRIIEKLDDKWAGDFMGLIEEEYGFAKYVDDFIKSKGYEGVITKERTSQKWGKIRPENITIFNPKDIEMVNLTDIYNKANKK